MSRLTTAAGAIAEIEGILDDMQEETKPDNKKMTELKWVIDQMTLHFFREPKAITKLQQAYHAVRGVAGAMDGDAQEYKGLYQGLVALEDVARVLDIKL